MLVRISPAGVGAELRQYLEEGRKAGRDYGRDELDRRVILAGDIGVMEAALTLADDMQIDERGLHITLSFKEPDVSEETLREITEDFRDFLLSAYRLDEIAFYAEAHIPRVREYADGRTGAPVGRLPHVHVVVAQVNLLSGAADRPLDFGEINTRYVDAWQELINERHGLASPKTAARIAGGRGDALSHRRGDDFTGPGGNLKHKVADRVFAGDIRSLDELAAAVADLGTVSVRNAGRPNAYLHVAPADGSRGVNLRESVFRADFLALSARDKALSQRGVGLAPEPSAEASRLVDEWRDRRAREVRWVDRAGPKFRTTYARADNAEKDRLLSSREQTYYRKFKGMIGHEPERHRAAERDLDRVKDHLRTAGDDLRAAKGTAYDPEHARRMFRARRLERALAADRAARDPHGRDRDSSARRTAEERRRRPQDVSESLERDRHDETTKERDVSTERVKPDIPAELVLEYAARRFGVDPTAYRVTKGQDGSDRIQAAGRRLTVSDFLTREVKLSWPQARQALDEIAAARQVGGPDVQRQRRPSAERSLWNAYLADHVRRRAQRDSAWSKQRASEIERRRAATTRYRDARQELAEGRHLPAVRKARLSTLRVARAVEQSEMQRVFKRERDELRTRYRPFPSRTGFEAWLQEEAGKGVEPALAELRRLGIAPAPTGDQVGRIHTPKGVDALLRFAGIDYRVAGDGSVTYSRAGDRLIVDSARQVDVHQRSDDAVELAMRLAALKVGPALSVDGDEDFKTRAVRVAIERRVNVSFTDRNLEGMRLAGLAAARTQSVPKGDPERSR